MSAPAEGVPKSAPRDTDTAGETPALPKQKSYFLCATPRSLAFLIARSRI